MIPKFTGWSITGGIVGGLVPNVATMWLAVALGYGIGGRIGEVPAYFTITALSLAIVGALLGMQAGDAIDRKLRGEGEDDE